MGQVIFPDEWTDKLKVIAKVKGTVLSKLVQEIVAPCIEEYLSQRAITEFFETFNKGG